jgi:hypothetical protein
MAIGVAENFEANRGTARPSASDVMVVVSESAVGVLKGHYKKGLPPPTVFDKIGKDEMAEVYAVLSIADKPQFFAYIIRSAELGFRQLHVFALAKGAERDPLLTELKRLVPDPTVLDTEIASNLDGGEVFMAEYVRALPQPPPHTHSHFRSPLTLGSARPTFRCPLL